MVRESRAAGIELGFHAVDLRTGRELGSSGADRGLIPASNQKLLTVAAFLHRLGIEHRFETGFAVRDGVLVVEAGGDPNWRTGGAHDPAALFAAVAVRLRHVGVTALRDVRIESGPFTGPTRPDGWPSDQYEKTYCAATAPALLDGGCWVARLSAPAGGAAAMVEVLSPPGGLPLDGRIPLTSDKKAGGLYGLAATGDGLRIWGKLWNQAGPREHSGALVDPGAAFVDGLRTGLQRGGIAFAADAPRNAEPIPLRSIDTGVAPTLLRVLKESDNNDAEMLLRVLGAATRDDGSFAGGAQAVRDALADLVGSVPDALHVADGSGLSRDDRVTARFVVELLRAARGASWWEELTAALPHGGEPGTTLRNRFRGESWAKQVHAKTGTINGVSALSGVCVDASGREIGFSILMNWTRRKSGSRDPRTLQESLVAALIGGRDS